MFRTRKQTGCGQTVTHRLVCLSHFSFGRCAAFERVFSVIYLKPASMAVRDTINRFIPVSEGWNDSEMTVQMPAGSDDAKKSRTHGLNA